MHIPRMTFIKRAVRDSLSAGPFLVAFPSFLPSSPCPYELATARMHMPAAVHSVYSAPGVCFKLAGHWGDAGATRH